MNHDELKKIHDLMLPAVREAGAAAMRFFRSSDFTITHKDAENPVTDADFAANRILRAAIEKYFPEDAILSEESDSPEERASMGVRAAPAPAGGVRRTRERPRCASGWRW